MQRIELGSYWKLNDKIFRVERTSSATNEIILKELETLKLFKDNYSTFTTAYTRVFKVKEVAEFLGRTPRSIYYHEVQEIIPRQKIYKVGNYRRARFYTIEDILEMHKIISEIDQGRPAKDKRITNNKLKPYGVLKNELMERYK